ncbi:tRNA (adenosine(37)-N6)-threonylcarbamoyltransferase complex dimerization subunit type 1 TsaB [Leptospira sp. 96542]|nr:tRNA (adenosine(37)-N6)-threonylcarbamoyltransferase complex dimerization subunit type 1 TsaB [Leptospira sp. 96542]
MNILCFDTTQDWVHIALYSLVNEIEPVSLIEMVETKPKESSFQLVEWIGNVLEQAGIKRPDIIFVPNGPGSFTGIRITVSTARNLSQLWKIPVFAMDSLQFYLSNIHKAEDQTLVCVDGKQNKYFCRFTKSNFMSESFDLEPNDIESKLLSGEWTPNNWYYTGQKPSFYPENAKKIEATKLNFLSILSLLRGNLFHLNLENNDYTTLVPNYLRGTYVDNK